MATRIRDAGGSRTARYRERQGSRGTRRVEVTVPAQDVELIRRLASELRAGGEQAQRARARVGCGSDLRPAQTGEELLAFFRSSPSVGEDLSFERDRSTGRPTNL